MQVARGVDRLSRPSQKAKEFGVRPRLACATSPVTGGNMECEPQWSSGSVNWQPKVSTMMRSLGR